jgi:hypothetical protein
LKSCIKFISYPAAFRLCHVIITYQLQSNNRTLEAYKTGIPIFIKAQEHVYMNCIDSYVELKYFNRLRVALFQKGS